MQKQDEIFDSLADNPDAIMKVAGVLKNIRPQDSIAIFENIAEFRKRIDLVIENKSEGDVEAQRKLTTLELICLILGALLAFTVNGFIGGNLRKWVLRRKKPKMANRFLLRDPQLFSV